MNSSDMLAGLKQKADAAKEVGQVAGMKALEFFQEKPTRENLAKKAQDVYDAAKNAQQP